MSRIQRVLPVRTPGGISDDAAGRSRVSTIRTLFDGKLANNIVNLAFEKAGTATHSTSNSKHSMSVTAGQWGIFTSKRPLIYSSGKSQVVECTFDGFAPQEGVVKRIGYFDSGTTSPFSSGLDGFWLETTDTSIKLCVKHSDIETPRVDIDITQWSGFSQLERLRVPTFWDGFTVVMWDFLWLGGANLRLFVMTTRGWVLAHQYIFASRGLDNTMTKTPSKPIRYEIRSTTGTGSMRYICSQGATEGDVSGSGWGRAMRTENITGATIGTTYPILGIRKNMDFQSTPIKITDFDVTSYSVNDRAVFTLQLNPTLSGAPTWSNVADSSAQSAPGNGTITVTGEGTVLASGTSITNIVLAPGQLDDNFLADIGYNLNGTSDEIWVCITPQTTTVTVNANISYKEF